MHTALWCLAAVSVVGAVISAARPKELGTSGRQELAERERRESEEQRGEQRPEPQVALS